MKNIEYHLAPGVRAVVDHVEDEDVKDLAKILENPNNVITVGNRKNNKLQHIPVRSILVVQITDVS